MELLLLILAAILVVIIARPRAPKATKAKKLAEPKAVPFLVMPIRRYVLYMALSLGLYSLYWHYTNWKAVKTREGSAISPFWRTAFLIIWLYPLFKKISYEAQKHGHPAKPDPGLLASVYIASWIASFPLAWLLPYGALLIVSLAVVSVFVLATIPVQQAANAVKVTGSPSRNSPTLGEIFFLLVGGAMLVINISTAIKMPGITPMEDVRMRMQSMKEYLRLSVDYAVCTENLKTRLSLLDRRDQEAVDSYNTAHEACEAIKVRMDELAKKLETGSRAY